MKFLLILLVFGIGLQIKAQTVPDQDAHLKLQGYTRFKSQQAPDILNPTWRNIIERLVNYCESNSPEKSSETFYYDLPDSERKKIAGDLEKSTVEYLALKKKLRPIIARMNENITQINTSLNNSADCLNLQSNYNYSLAISRLITDYPKFKTPLEALKKSVQSQNERIEKECVTKQGRIYKLSQKITEKEELLRKKDLDMNPLYFGLTLEPIQIWKFKSGPCESLEIKRSSNAFEKPGYINLITRTSVSDYYGRPTNTIHILTNNYSSLLYVTPDDKVILKKAISYRKIDVVAELIKNLNLSLAKTPPSPPTGTYTPAAKTKHAQ